MEGEIRQSDFDWFLNSTREQSKYKGQFVAIFQNKIIASGASFKETRDKAKEIVKNEKVLISLIPEDEGLELELAY